MAKGYFEYKGKNSLDFDLYIENAVSFPSPAADVEFIKVLGKDGEVAVDNQRLESVPFLLPVRLRLSDQRTVEETAGKISAWLKNDIGWYPLRFSGSEEFDYIAICVDQYNVEQNLINYGHAIIPFKMKPYKMLRNNESLLISHGKTLFNRQSRVAQPIVTITGNGDITFKNNGKDWIVLTSVDGSITIDSEAGSIYKDDLAQNKKMKSHLQPRFPVLSPGENTITWVGSVTKVEIEPRWNETI